MAKETVHVFDDRERSRIRDVVRFVEANKSRLLKLFITPKRAWSGGSGEYERLVHITGWAQIGTKRKWWYSGIQVVLYNNADEPAYQIAEGAVDMGLCIFSTIEMVNTASGTGVQGNGVDESSGDFPSGFELIPLGAGTGGTPANGPIVAISPAGFTRTIAEVAVPCWRITNLVSTHDGSCT